MTSHMKACAKCKCKVPVHRYLVLVPGYMYLGTAFIYMTLYV